MTFPVFCAIHLVYGVAMAFAVQRRMRAEGEVLGIPLLATLVPVGLVSAPLSAVLLRFSGSWFLHGAFHGEGSIAFERFHLGLMFATGLSAGLLTVTGMFFAIAFLTRDRPRMAMVPVGCAAAFVVVLLIGDWESLLVVPGTGRTIFTHPVGLVSLADVLVLAAAWMFAQKRLSFPVGLRA